MSLSQDLGLALVAGQSGDRQNILTPRPRPSPKGLSRRSSDPRSQISSQPGPGAEKLLRCSCLGEAHTGALWEGEQGACIGTCLGMGLPDGTALGGGGRTELFVTGEAMACLYPGRKEPMEKGTSMTQDGKYCWSHSCTTGQRRGTLSTGGLDGARRAPHP